MKIIKVLLLVFLSFVPFSSFVYSAEEEMIKGTIKEVVYDNCGGISEIEDLECVSYEIQLVNGDTVSTSPTMVNNPGDVFRKGSKVYVSKGIDFDGSSDIWNVQSYSNENALLVLSLVFILLIFIITGSKGLRSTLGLIISFLVIYLFTIPQLLNGSNIVLISLFSIFFLLCASTFITYGFNMKSLIAFISTTIGIGVIFLLGSAVISLLGISGSGEESSAMLYEATGGVFNLSDIFLLSIVIGSLGVLDDVTIGQTSSIMEMYGMNKGLDWKQVYIKSMNIGKDHISSMVNTLFIAYAGSSFTLVMLIYANNPDWRMLLNTGFVTEEIVRTLVASIGLVLVVPVTSFLASKMVVRFLN